MDFDYEGMYRVQSRTPTRAGRVAGDWLEFGDGLLSAGAVNRMLSGHAYWSGVTVNLRCAMVDQREGMFHEVPDNLYKMEHFTPLQGTRPFPSHIVDIRKALDQWRDRWPLVSSLFVRDQADELVSLIDELPVTIANEYYCHEAGHVLGRSVQSKSASEYFKPAGKPAWPLIWMEEFRADLHSYSIALELLKPRQAAAMFVYNWFSRLAGDRLSLQQSTYGYGPIPFLIFAVLLEVGFIRIRRSGNGPRLIVTRFYPTSIAEIMMACHRHAFEHLTSVECSTDNRLDWALNAAQYYRDRVNDNPVRFDYQELLESKSFAH